LRALMDRWFEDWQLHDKLHARTAAANGGVKDLDDILMFKESAPGDVADPSAVGERVQRTMQKMAEGKR
jgi:hypothetical protein